MKKNIGVIAVIVLLVGAFAGLIAWSLISKKANEVDYDKYDAHSIIEGTEDNGNIADHIKGSADAPVVIFEYADYQCPGCATTNPRLNKLIEEYDGKVAVVYRNFLLSYHQNGTAAASAAEAAAIQGYWEEYADLLFANQSTWEYASAEERGDMFKDLFRTVSNGEGDLEKFEADMASSAVKKKIDFDMGIGQKIGVPGTPGLYMDGERIDFSEAGTETKFLELMHSKVDAKLKELGLK